MNETIVEHSQSVLPPRGATGRIHHVETFGTVDGPGVRYVLFLQGCPLRCLYCHNPDAIDPRGGNEWTASHAVQEVLRYASFVQGVTFSGGEPLLQPEFVLEVTQRLSARGLHVAIDTAGAPHLERCKPAIDAADMLLLDIKAACPDLATKLTGHSNARAIATLDYCEKIGKRVWLRHVLVPGYTLVSRQLEKLARLLQPYQCIELIELAPFHQLGAEKWAAAGMTYHFKHMPPADPAQVTQAVDYLEDMGFKVQ